MTNYFKFCLYPEKKKSLEHYRKSTGRRPTFGTHTSWPSLFLGCGLLLPLLLLLLVLVSAVCAVAAAFVVASGPLTVEPATFAMFDLPKMSQTICNLLPPHCSHKVNNQLL